MATWSRSAGITDRSYGAYRGSVSLPVHAPWRLEGEAVVLVGRCSRRSRPPLPRGLAPVPGPWVVAAAMYRCSPVGPYTELTVAQLARIGARPGWCATTTVGSSVDARVGAVVNWGFPKQLGT